MWTAVMSAILALLTTLTILALALLFSSTALFGLVWLLILTHEGTSRGQGENRGHES